MTYYTPEVGHVLHVTPDAVGELTPGELLFAVKFFEARYQRG